MEPDTNRSQTCAPEADFESAFRRHLRRAMVTPIVALLVASAALVSLLLLVERLNRDADRSDAILERANTLEKLVIDRQGAFRGYVLTGYDDFLRSFTAIGDDVDRTLALLQKSIAEHPSEPRVLAVARTELGQWNEYATRLIQRRQWGAEARDLGPHIPEGQARVDAIVAQLKELRAQERSERDRSVIASERLVRYAPGSGFLLAIVLGPIVALATARQMRRIRTEYRRALAEQARMAESLREADEKLRLAQDAAEIGVWHRNLVTGEMSWSDRCRELYAVPSGAELTYKRFLAAIHPDDRDRIDRTARAAVTFGTEYDAEMRVPQPDGTVRWIASKGKAFYDADGHATRMAGIVFDVTARKELDQRLRESEAALAESDRRKDEFLGVLSHELRNPLAPIRNCVYVLGHADPGSEQARRAVATIARQVEHLTRIVDDLLDVKRISTGKLRLRRQRIDLVPIVRDSAEDLRPVFGSKGIALEVATPGTPVWVDGDATRVAQVVTNLLHNASKFTDSGGHVRVSVDHDDGEAWIRVRDDGLGVAPEMLGAMFEPFTQSEKTLHRTRGGLGLGLALVRGIAELHGGSVAATSDGPGTGTEVVVRIAAVAGESATRESRPVSSREDAEIRRKVLLIEDSEDAAESLREVLEIMGGHEVIVARDGEAGLVAAREHAPDVILCDIGLPVMDGYEVARRLRDPGSGVGGRLIALTGYSSPEDVDRAVRAGFDFHLAKPPDIDAVLKLVAEAPRAGGEADLPAAIVTGHHEVDAQHASILRMVADLRAAPAAGVWTAIDFLTDYTASHFAYEEALMAQVDYPDRARHRSRHLDFVRRYRKVREELESEGATPDRIAAFVGMVEAWVTGHVLAEDRRLAEFIRGRKAAA